MYALQLLTLVKALVANNRFEKEEGKKKNSTYSSLSLRKSSPCCS